MVMLALRAGILTISAGAEQNEMVCRDVEIMLPLNGPKEVVNLLVADGRHLPASLTNEVMMQAVRNRLEHG